MAPELHLVTTDPSTWIADDPDDDELAASHVYDRHRRYVVFDPATKQIATTFHVPKELLTYIRLLLDQRWIPEYQTVDDFFRDATVHHLVQLGFDLKNIGLTNKDLDRIAEQAAHIHGQTQETHAKLESVIANMAQAVEVARRNPHMMPMVVENITRDLEWMPAGYRERAIALLGSVEQT